VAQNNSSLSLKHCKLNWNF